MSGGDLPYWRTPQAITAAVRASHTWWKNADVPDVLNRIDARKRPHLIAYSMDQRIRREMLFGIPHLLQFPKPSGGLRTMTVLDPIDELLLRQQVGRLIAEIESALGPEVHSSRSIRLSGGEWAVEDWRRAGDRHRASIQTERESERWHGMGKLDVRSHYPTISLDTLRLVLCSAGCSPNAVEDLLATLRVLQLRSRSTGLPIGPEASAPLGTIALAPLDRMLRSQGVVFLRWVDDVLMFVDAQEVYETLKELADTHLHVVDQELNLPKCTYETFGSDDLAGFENAYGGLQIGTGIWFDDPAAALADLGEARRVDGATRALGQLRSREDPAGVDVLLAHPWLIFKLPTPTGAYLRRVRKDIQNWDAIASLVMEDVEDETAAGQLRLVRLLERKQIGASLGREFFDRGRALDRTRFAPVANEFLAAAGRSQESSTTRQRRAADTAVEFADLNAKRALLGACLREMPDRSLRSTLEHLGRLEPDLAALLDLVAA
jgi:hypothetical protein